MRAENDADAAVGAFIVVRKQPFERGEPAVALEAAAGGGSNRRISHLRCGREEIRCTVEPQPPSSCEVEDHALARPELVDEGRRATLHDLQQPDGDESFELVVVEAGHGQRAHRHQHGVDLALTDGTAGQVVDDAAE